MRHNEWVVRSPQNPEGDRGNRRLQTFTLDGSHLKTIERRAADTHAL